MDGRHNIMLNTLSFVMRLDGESALLKLQALFGSRRAAIEQHGIGRRCSTASVSLAQSRQFGGPLSTMVT